MIETNENNSVSIPIENIGEASPLQSIASPAVDPDFQKFVTDSLSEIFGRIQTLEDHVKIVFERDVTEIKSVSDLAASKIEQGMSPLKSEAENLVKDIEVKLEQAINYVGNRR